MRTTITEGSIWWTTKPSWEAEAYRGCGYRYDGVDNKFHYTPRQVKAWTYKLAFDHMVVRLSAFDENGKINDDGSCTCGATDRDIGVTVFESEVEAWKAYFGVVTTLRIALMRYDAISDAAKNAAAEHIKSLESIIEKLSKVGE